MPEESRLDTIEIKLAHLERSLQELGQTVMNQQREIVALAARNRVLEQQLEAFDQEVAQGSEPFEKPPHY
ncbi:MAG: SlyX family protein [Steroidobacteraceae bacterium]